MCRLEDEQLVSIKYLVILSYIYSLTTVLNIIIKVKVFMSAYLFVTLSLLNPHHHNITVKS